MRKPERVEVDANRNRIFVPGSGNIETVGLDRKALGEAEKQWLRTDVLMRRAMASTWQCLECRQKFPGTEIRMKGKGLETRVVCPECDGPVVVKDDALGLRTVPSLGGSK